MNVPVSMANTMRYATTAAKMAVSATPPQSLQPDAVPARATSPRGMSIDAFLSLFASNAKKDAVASGVATALSNPKLKAPEHSKEVVRQRIEEIKKRLNIFRNLYANDPKGMAKALAQVFKDLRAALKEYKAAGEQELGMSKDLTADALGPADAQAASDAATADATGEKPAKEATDDTKTAETEKLPAEAAKATEEPVIAADTPVTPTTGSDAETAKNDRASLGKAIEQTFRKTIGEDVLTFAKQVSGLVDYIEEKLLNPARLQMKARKPDKETEKAFEAVDKALKDLRKDIDDTARDIKQAVPSAGMHLDVTA